MKGIEIKKLKVHKDGRGFLYEILRSEDVGNKFGQIAITVAKPNAIRGNHHHKRTEEWYCLIKGKMKLALKNTKTGEREELIISDEEPCIIRIGRYISHGFKNISNDALYLLIYTDKPYNPKDPDSFPDIVIE